MAKLEELVLNQEDLAGSLPAGLAEILLLRVLDVGINRLSSTLPAAVSSLQQLQFLALEDNSFWGNIPEVVAARDSLQTLSLSKNCFTAFVPDAIAAMSALRELHLSRNKLTSSLPGEIGALQLLKELSAGGNRLQGHTPILSRTKVLALNSNMFAGSLPGSLPTMQEVQRLFLTDNAVTGNIPAALCSLATLEALACGKNMLEGTLPACLGQLVNLYLLDVAGRDSGPRMQGSLPEGLACKNSLSWVLAHDQRFEGSLPAFSSTLGVLALQHNALQTLRAYLRISYAVLLHRNHLSCQLPTTDAVDSHDWPARWSLVAVGNHLARPRNGNFPNWVLPFERDGLFWCDMDVGLWLAAKIIMGFSFFAMVFLNQVGCARYVVIMDQWSLGNGADGLIVQRAKGILILMLSQVLGGCVVLMLALNCDFYFCPTATTMNSACLSKSSYIQALVIVHWGRFWKEAWQRWQDSSSIGPLFVSRRSSNRPPQLQAWLRRLSVWVLWILLVLLLSGLVITDVAAKCMASVFALGAGWVRVLDLAIGPVQGLLSGILVPYLASKVSCAEVGRAALVSFASVLLTCLIPAFVVFYLDVACADRWTTWWNPCLQDVHIFDMEAQWDAVVLKVLQHNEVCSPSRGRSVASCARNMALKLQDMMLSKLVTSVFIVPALQVALGMHYTKVDRLIVKLVLLLELGMLLGPSLPLTVPLLCMSIPAEVLLAALARNKGKFTATFTEPVDTRCSFRVAGGCSLLFHASFVSQDRLANVLLCLGAVLSLAHGPSSS